MHQKFKRLIIALAISFSPLAFAEQPTTAKTQLNQSSYKYDHNINYSISSQIGELSNYKQYLLNELEMLNNSEQEQDKKKIEIYNKQIKKIDFTLNNMIDFYANLYDEMPERFVMVNIPSYQLIAFDDDYNPTLQSKVVVGGRTTRTPLKKLDIVSLKFNPTWTPTTNMTKRMLFKNGTLDTDYIMRHNLTPYLDGEAISFDDLVDMNLTKREYNQMQHRLTFTQGFGKNNPLGSLKFETNSKDNIYLHDTNQPSLFNKNKRALSSGCIRVQNYLDLASWLKYDDPNKQSNIEGLIKKDKTYYHGIKRTLVYFTYFTTLINEDGKLIEFDDIYKFEK